MEYYYFGGGGAGWPPSETGCGGRRKTLAAVMATRAPRPSSIRQEAMRAAEAAARVVVVRVVPTAAAERARQGVVDYLGRLLGSALGCEVIAFGSVPLKSYLPDGDVDITVLGNTALDNTYIADVYNILQSEQQDSGAELEIKGLQFINAEVKLIKCVIENIVVDISFNQIGGVSTLCFLELADRKVGKNHLFKRSIMLIKAWCYHESRILGAHHGLLSTYALDTLVLYIFNIFHRSLHGPLEALYMFLEYFSKFDWDKYCISLNGPILLSSLPNLAVERSSINDELLFGKEMLGGSIDRLIVLPEVSDGSNINFCFKHLNIIDPLKWSNNLGRSVSRGSFYRIRGAFSFGAQKLGQILMLPSNLIPTEIFGFFENTLKRHGRGERSDVGSNDSVKSFLAPKYALGKNAPDLNNADTSEDENISPNLLRTSDRYFCGNAKDRPWNKIWFTNSDVQYDNMFSGNGLNSRSTSFTENGGGNIKQHSKDCSAGEDLPPVRSLMEKQIYANNNTHLLTPTRTNTYPDESSWSDIHDEILLLSPRSPSNFLGLSGDLDLQLECLRKIQYHLESMFDGLVQLIQQAFLSGMLDEDSFKIPTESFSNTDAIPSGLLSHPSGDTEQRSLSPLYCLHSTGGICHKSHMEDQVNAVCQQNATLSNGLILPSSPGPVSWFHNTQDIPRAHQNGMQTLNDVPLLLGTDVLSNVVGLHSFPAAGSENYNHFWSHSTTNSRMTRGTGTFIPRMSYNTYEERILSEKGRKQRERLTDRPLKIKTNPTGMGCSDGTNGGITIGSTKYIPKNQNSSQQDYSRRSVVPAEGDSAPERALANRVTKLTQTSQSWNVDNNQHGFVCSETNMVDSQKPGTNKGLSRPNKESMELPILGCQAPLPSPEVRHQIKTKQDGSLQFGSFGDISLSAPCLKFTEAFPPLPSSKKPAEATISTPTSSRPAETESRLPILSHGLNSLM
uniref:PAP/OAS1 substrate-binding-related domain-containing protein n=1 Tax=Leersia perrieri TaxID=77586 RepID=A0A0D9XYH5_9ORYZ